MCLRNRYIPAVFLLPVSVKVSDLKLPSLFPDIIHIQLFLIQINIDVQKRPQSCPAAREMLILMRSNIEIKIFFGEAFFILPSGNI